MKDVVHSELLRLRNLTLTTLEAIDGLAATMNISLTEDFDQHRIDLWFDGGMKPGKAYGSYRIGEENPTRFRLKGVTSSNQAEYASMIRGLEAVVSRVEPAQTRLRVYGDSQIVIHQMADIWACNSSSLRPLFEAAREIVKAFYTREFVWVPREDMVAIFGH